MQNKFFLESSALIKRYKSELGTECIDNLFLEGSDKIFCSNLSIVEINKVFVRLRYYPQGGEGGRESPISQETYEKIQSAFSRDLISINIVQITQAMIDVSLDILLKGWIPSSIDIIQLAAYLETKKVHKELIFVCADERLNELAEKIITDINIINPNKNTHSIIQIIRINLSKNIVMVLSN